MRLLFDLIRTQKDNGRDIFHGGGEHVKRLFMEVIKKNDKSFNVIGLCKNSFAMDPLIEKVCHNENIQLIFVDSYKEVDSIVKANNIDRFYSGLVGWGNNAQIKNCEVYVTIHGVRSVEMPADKTIIHYDYPLIQKIKDLIKYYFPKWAVKRARKSYYAMFNSNVKRVYVASYHTKYSLMALFPDIKDDVFQVYYSPEKYISAYQDTGILKKLNLNRREYFLLISANRWIKNNYRAIKAFDELFSERDIQKKVLVLGVTPDSRFTKIVKNKSKFLFYDYVSEMELENLYKNAYAFVYPTLNEGFGVPPIEAMRYGTPVIASAVNSITEVCGDGVLYVNPYFIFEIKARILQLLESEYEKMRENSLHQYHIISKKQKEILTGEIKDMCN